MLHLAITVLFFVIALGGVPAIVYFKHDGPTCQCSKCQRYRARRHAYYDPPEEG